MNRVNRLESNSDAEDEPEDDTDKIIKKYKRVMLFCLSYVMLAEVRCLFCYFRFRILFL